MSVSIQTLPSNTLQALQVVVTEQGPTTVIAVSGDWDLAGQPAIHETFRRALARPPERLVLDLSHLTLIDATGLHGVLALSQRTQRLDIALAIVPGCPAVRRTFEMCRLTQRLPFITS